MRIYTINRRALTKAKLFNDDRFFRMLSGRCNYVDETTVRMFYFGLIRLMVSELRTNKAVRLPHLGDFALIEYTKRKGVSGRHLDGTPRYVTLTKANVFKFYPKYTLKSYFNKMQRKPLGQ